MTCLDAVVLSLIVLTVRRNPERLLFASTTQAFLEKEASLTRVRELHAAGISFEPGWWRRAAELGWTSLLVPEELGGGSVSGDGVEDLAPVAELIGRTVAPGPLHPVSTVLAGLVERPKTMTDTIEALISGEAVASWAVYEPGKSWDPLDPEVTATPTAAGFRIDGVKDRVEAGAESAVLLVVARVRRRGPPVPGRRRNARCAGRAVPVGGPGEALCPGAFRRCRGRRVRGGRNGGADAGPDPAPEPDREVLQCAEIVGILDTVVGLTIQWAFDRHSFGRPLASYQALKHHFADLKIWFEACRATTSAVAEVGKRSPGADMAVSVAKSYVAEHAPGMLQDCIQLHGGIGVTWEHDLHLFLRRVTLYRSLFGTPEEHNLRVYALTEALESAS